MNYNFNVGDQVITTRGNVGVIEEVVPGSNHIQISPEFAGFNMKNNFPMVGQDGKTRFMFINEEGEETILTLGEDFDYVNTDRYVVKFQKNSRQFHPAALRLFDREFTVNTIQTEFGHETHIECKYHNSVPNGVILLTEIKTPYNTVYN